MSRHASISVAVLAAAMFCVVPTGRVEAQPADRPVAFVHGISSDGGTWATMAPYLASVYRIRTAQPSLPSSGHAAFESQAVALKSGLQGDTTQVILVAHSNGGIVSRLARKNGLDVQSITTMGSTHLGAPLAANVLNGKVGAWGGQLIFKLTDAFAQAPSSWWSWIRGILNVFRIAADQWVSTIQTGISLFTSSWAVLPEMVPFGAFQSNVIGQPDVHGSPESAIPNRVSIQVFTQQPTTGIFFAGTLPAHRTAGIVSRTATIAIYTMLSQYYQSSAWTASPYSQKRADHSAAAVRFAAGAAALLAMDAKWCEGIGAAPATFTIAPNGCGLSDGVVPLANQYWTGATSILTTAAGHGAETSNLGIANIVGTSTFDYNFTVPRR